MHLAKAQLHKTHIAGVLVQAHPDHVTQVRNRLADVAGLEVHMMSLDGRIVVTVEGEGRQCVADALFSLNAMRDVLSANLVYEHSETDYL